MATAEMGEYFSAMRAQHALILLYRFFVNGDQYTSEMNVARQYAKQKQWPRAIFVRRARYYHAARLRWNCMERLRGPVENSLIDDVVEWSMWHYASSKPWLIFSSHLLTSSLSSQTVRIRLLDNYIALKFWQSQPVLAWFDFVSTCTHFCL